MKYDITVGIPTYNRAHCLGRAISSALAMTDVNIEIIVCDNCSTDDTAVEMQRFSGNPIVKYFRSSFNIGPTANYNQCLERASGQYFMILGDDDWLSPNYGQVLMETTKNRDVVFVGRCIATAPDGTATHMSSDSEFEVSGPEFIRDLIQLEPYTSRHAYFMFAAKTNAIRHAGGFPSTEAGQHADNMLLMRLLLDRKICNNPTAVNYYAVYPESYGNSNVKSVAIATLQLVDYWDAHISAELAKRLSGHDADMLRSRLVQNATLTYIHRVLTYGTGFSQRLSLLLSFPKTTWLIRVIFRLKTISALARMAKNLVKKK